MAVDLFGNPVEEAVVQSELGGFSGLLDADPVDAAKEEARRASQVAARRPGDEDAARDAAIALKRFLRLVNALSGRGMTAEEVASDARSMIERARLDPMTFDLFEGENNGEG